MRYLRLQRSQANRRRTERGTAPEADRAGPRATPVQPASADLAYPVPAKPAVREPGTVPRKCTAR